MLSNYPLLLSVLIRLTGFEYIFMSPSILFFIHFTSFRADIELSLKQWYIFYLCFFSVCIPSPIFVSLRQTDVDNNLYFINNSHTTQSLGMGRTIKIAPKKMKTNCGKLFCKQQKSKKKKMHSDLMYNAITHWKETIRITSESIYFMLFFQCRPSKLNKLFGCSQRRLQRAEMYHLVYGNFFVKWTTFFFRGKTMSGKYHQTEREGEKKRIYEWKE